MEEFAVEERFERVILITGASSRYWREKCLGISNCRQERGRNETVRLHCMHLDTGTHSPFKWLILRDEWVRCVLLREVKVEREEV